MKRFPKAAFAAALVASFTLLNAALFHRIWNLGTAVLAGLTALLWLGLLCPAGRTQQALKRLCRLGWGFFLGCCAVMYAVTLAHPLPADAGPAVIVVPGAQVKEDRPSLMLQNRLDRGLQLYEQHPGSVFVVSGGRAEGDPFSEAEVMARYLTQKGVDPDCIYPENQAASTEENFRYAAEMIAQNGLEGRVVIATDAFHQTRCRLWAARFGLEEACSAVCFPCWGIAPVYWLREVCGVAHFYLFA